MSDNRDGEIESAAMDALEAMTIPTPDEICERLFGRLGVFYMARTAWAEKNWTDKVDEVNEAERKLRDLIQQQRATIERLSAALKTMMEAYRCEADPYSIGGFHRNLDEDECMVEALAALGETA